MNIKYSKAQSFYNKVEKSSIENENPVKIINTMVVELKKSMEIVVNSINLKDKIQIRSKHFSRALVIIYTLQTSLDFEKGKTLAGKLFQIYEYCRTQLIKCFSKKIVEGANKAIEALNDIFLKENFSNG